MFRDGDASQREKRGPELIAMVQGKNSSRNHLVRFWSNASGFWRGKSAVVSWPLAIGLLLIGVSQLAVQYKLNYWNRDFFNALARRDASGLWNQVVIFAPLACLSIGLSVTSVWARMTTQRKWREWLTANILDTWLSRERYRRLASASGEYQNAEYRISYDARLATDAPVDLTLGFITSALSALVFAGVLWNIGGSLTLFIGRIEMTIPGYLVVGAGIYALVFTGAMMVIGRRLPAVVQTQSQAEAELLAAANQIRESAARAEAPPGDIERHRAVRDALRQVLMRWRQLCWQLMGTTLVSQTDVLFAPVFGWALCTPKYLAGTMTLGELTQASAAFVTVQVAFNWLVDNYQRLSDWRSAASRVAALLLAFDELAISDKEKEAGFARAGLRSLP
jgi:vitamin B12/bleomycin/antimicrobial peptide transport system ATP-binding/permease protein